VPWAEPRSRFTLLFERFAIDVLLETEVPGAAGVLDISWDEAHGIAGFANLNEFGRRRGGEQVTRRRLTEPATSRRKSYGRWAYRRHGAAVRDFYDAISSQFPNNPSAAGRAILMSESTDQLGCK
jgi:Helix-turn-helix domain of transposase family ISL3